MNRLFYSISIGMCMQLCLLIQIANGQPVSDFVFTHITTENGLPHNNVYAICQDSDGYMWFGTQNGLSRYDGKSFVNFYHNPSDINTISVSNFGKILEDHAGNLWLGTFGGGLDCYYPDSNTYKHYLYDRKGQNSGNKLITWLYEDNDSLIWIGCVGDGLYCYDFRTDAFTNFTQDITNTSNSLVNNLVRSMTEDAQRRIWIATSEGLSVYSKDNGTFVNYKHDATNPNTLSSDNIQTVLYQKSSNTIWVGTYDAGVNTINPDNGIVTRVTSSQGISEKQINILYEDSYGNIWVGSNSDGLFLYQESTQKFINFVYSPYNYQGISHDRIMNIYEDGSHNLWVATQGGGLNKLNIKPRKFYAYTYIPGSTQTIRNPNVMNMCSFTDSTFLVATDGGGINLLTQEGTFVDHFGFNATDATSLSSDRVWDMLKDSKGYIWVGTYFAGLSRSVRPYDMSEFIHFKAIAGDANSLAGDVVTCIFEDHMGEIWVGTHQGLNRVQYTPDSTVFFKQYYYLENSEIQIGNSYITCLYEDSYDNLWIGTVEAGLNLFNREKEIFSSYTVDTSITTINSNHILSVKEDNNKDLWVGTNSGLNKLNRKTGEFTRIDLFSFTYDITDIYCDNNNILWLASGRGLWRFNPETNEALLLDKSDGLPDISFNRNSSFEASDGNVWMGTIGGLVRFSPEKFQINTTPPPVQITDVKKGELSIWMVPDNRLKVSDKDRVVELTYNDRILSIEFAALDYTFPEKNMYMYKLDNFDKEWQVAGNRQYVMYTNLPPGSYVFRVKGSNDDDVWSEEEVGLHIVVHPPFWFETWFFILSALLLAGSIFLYIKLRTRSLSRAKHVLEEKVQERTLQIQLQSNLLKQQNEDIKASIRYAQTIQDALLDVAQDLDNLIENFIIYKPKDIVSGDFYWFSELTDSKQERTRMFFVVADCTGHGVPGAFMSLIGNRLLTEIIVEKRYSRPDMILHALNTGIRKTLKQDKTENDDGMDLCLCVITKVGDKQNVWFAGAKRPLFHFRSELQTVEILKGARKPIGGKPSALDKLSYDNVQVDVKQGDVLYLTSDGFIDQHGPDKKRVGTKHFVELLEQYGTLPLKEQKQILEKILSNHQKNEYQRDDITVMAIRLS